MQNNNFWNNKKIEDRGYETPCWIWQGALDKDGYGVSHDGTRKLPTHRLAFKLTYPNEFSALKLVLHKCNVSSCFNPVHLFQGDQSDNIKHCVASGRHPKLRKTKCSNGHELTPENTYIAHRTKNGRPTTYRRCKICCLIGVG